MSPRLAFAAFAAMTIIPVAVFALLAGMGPRMRRWMPAAPVGVAAAVWLLSRPAAQPLLRVLSAYRVLPVAMLTGWSAVIVTMLVGRAARTRRARRLCWTRLPPQREFGGQCCAFLERRGWSVLSATDSLLSRQTDWPGPATTCGWSQSMRSARRRSATGARR